MIGVAPDSVVLDSDLSEGVNKVSSDLLDALAVGGKCFVGLQLPHKVEEYCALHGGSHWVDFQSIGEPDEVACRVVGLHDEAF